MTTLTPRDALEVDLDTMRDVYMTKAQREAYERICAQALVERAGEPVAWMPIETVPKGNGVVLFCDARGNKWAQCADSWEIPFCGLPASLWMPLPTAPGASHER